MTPTASAAGARTPGSRAEDEIRILARGGSLAVAGVAVGAMLQFLVVLVLTRGLDAGSAGALLETIAYFTIVGNTTALGTDAGVIRELSARTAAERPPQLRRLLTVAGSPVAAIGLVLAVVSFVAAHPIAGVFFDPAHRHGGAIDIRIVAPALPLAGLTIVGLAATRGLGTMLPWVAVQNLGVPALRLAFVITAVASGVGGALVTVAWTVPVVAGAAATLVVVGRLVRRTEAARKAPLGLAYEGPDFARFWRFCAPRAVGGALDFIVLTLDVLLVGALRSTRDAAVYAAASRFVVIGTFLLAAVSRPLTEQFGRLLALGDTDAVGALYHLSTRWTMVLGWPLYIVCLLFGGTVMSLFGSGYSSGMAALMTLSLASLLDLGTGNMNTLLVMSGKSGWELGNSIMVVVLNVTLNVVLIPKFGITGAALAWAASIVALNVAWMVEVHILLELRPFDLGSMSIVGAIGLAYGAIGGVARLALGDSPIGLAIAAVAGTILFAGLLRHARETLRLDDLVAVLRPGS